MPLIYFQSETGQDQTGKNFGAMAVEFASHMKISIFFVLHGVVGLEGPQP